MAEIQLTCGKVATVDDAHAEHLRQWKWIYSKGYATASLKTGDLYLHRVVLELVLGRPLLPYPQEMSDHIDGNRLDCRASNLRLVTRRQNTINRRSTAKSGWKGVYYVNKEAYGRNPLAKPWNAKIEIDGKSKSLGYYANPREAAYAYNEAALEHFGEFAKLNQVFALEADNG